MSDAAERERWARVDAAFEEVLLAPPAERARVAATVCGDDSELRAEVESLLAAHAAAGAFLESPAEIVAAPYLDEVRERGADRAGAVVGRYRLVEEVGRGGMGTVWLAERTGGEFEQKVAVKLVKRGMDTDEILDRFLRERRILARLEHPNIARIVDGGATDDGRPYFVMEHVAGVPITQFCAGLPVHERLGLFEVVCAAVQHAHRNLVVHRDLKPSNVLVTATGEVKLLDFGIAKLLEEDDAAQPTRTGARFATPDYASPEQVRGEPATTQSDVYQLGLLLYEILAGRRPYSLSGKSPTEVERIVCEEDPPRPSVAAREGDGARGLEGDLDTIVGTALRKDPARRYASAEAMAEDVRRHLDGLPVRARGDGVGYRAGKFLRRHRVPVAAAAALVVLTSAFVVAYTVRLREERDRVRLEAEKATASAELLERFFVSWNPDAADRSEVSALDVLDAAAARAERASGDPPEVRAATFSLIGSLYAQLSQFAKAESLLVRAERLQRGSRGAPADLAATNERLGQLHESRAEFAAAEARYREALAVNRAVHGPAHPRSIATQVRLASVLASLQRFDEAERELRALLALPRAGGDLPLPVARGMLQLGSVLFFQGRLAEAEAALRAALAEQSRFYGRDDPIRVETAGILAAVLRDQGELEEAERTQRDVLARMRARYGESHPRTLNAKFLLAMVLERRAKYEEAERLAREGLSTQGRLLGPDDPTTAGWGAILGSILLDEGRDPDEAEALLARGLEMSRRALAYDEEAGDYLNRLSYLRLRRGAPDGPATYREALEFHRSRPPGDPEFVTDGFHFLAWSMARMGDVEEAEALYRRALALYDPALPPDHPYVAATREGLAAIVPAGSSE